MSFVAGSAATNSLAKTDYEEAHRSTIILRSYSASFDKYIVVNNITFAFG